MDKENAKSITKQQFKKKCFNDAINVIFKAIDDNLTTHTLKQIVAMEIKLLHDTYFGN